MSTLIPKHSKFALCSALCLLLTGCFNTSQIRQADPENAGEVVIFTNVRADEAAGVFVNGKFIAALPQYHQFSHYFCEGDYTLQARGVVSQSTSNTIQHLEGEYKLKVKKGTIQFISLQRTPEGWAFIPARYVSSGLDYNDVKLVRRLPDEMLKCK